MGKSTNNKKKKKDQDFRDRPTTINPADKEADDSFFKLKLWLLLIRFTSIAFVTSEFVPDEYWQGTEVAYWIVNAKGYLTWEWRYGLRGFLYPFFLSTPLMVLQKLGYANVEPYFMLLWPRTLQTGVTYFAEYKFLQMIRNKYGNESGHETAQLFITNWFLMYCSSRTLTNTMEMSLNLLAFTYLTTGRTVLFTIYGILAFLIRPTSIIIWIPISLEILSKVLKNSLTFFKSSFAVLVLLSANTLLDKYYYGNWEFPTWKFFQFNVLEGKSAMFGIHHKLWYFYSALPSILGLNILWIIFGVFISPHKYKQHISISVVYLIIFSLIDHKEIRFLLPIVPHLLAIAGDFIATMNKSGKKVAHFTFLRSNFVTVLLCLNAILNIVAAIVFSQCHQVGIKPAAKLVISDAEKSKIEVPNIWIMMPCFSMPVYTYLSHPTANYEFLTCSPPGLEFNSTNQQLVDFSEFNFHEFIGEKLKSNTPDYILTFDQKSKELQETFRLFGLEFETLEKYYHTLLPFDNVGKAVHVLKTIKS